MDKMSLFDIPLKDWKVEVELIEQPKTKEDETLYKCTRCYWVGTKHETEDKSIYNHDTGEFKLIYECPDCETRWNLEDYEITTERPQPKDQPEEFNVCKIYKCPECLKSGIESTLDTNYQLTYFNEEDGDDDSIGQIGICDYCSRIFCMENYKPVLF